MQSIKLQIGIVGIAVLFALTIAGCATTFEQLDTDNSGTLSRTEAGRAVSQFGTYDSNKDGVLNSAEYSRARRALRARSPSRAGSFGS